MLTLKPKPSLFVVILKLLRVLKISLFKNKIGFLCCVFFKQSFGRFVLLLFFYVLFFSVSVNTSQNPFPVSYIYNGFSFKHFFEEQKSRLAEEQKSRCLNFSSKSGRSNNSKACDKSKNAAVTNFYSSSFCPADSFR